MCAGEPPSRVDGAPSDRGQTAARHSKWQTVEAQAVTPLIRLRQKGTGFAVNRAAGDQGILFHPRRTMDDGDRLFLVNTSLESASSGTVETTARGVEDWSLETGAVAPYPRKTNEKGTRLEFDLPPAGSLLLFLAKESRPSARPLAEKTNTVVAASAPRIQRLEPNVLVLDHVDITAAGETRTNPLRLPGEPVRFQKNGMARNPWDSAVQFRDETITKTFPESSGFTATYRFHIAEKRRLRCPSSLSGRISTRSLAMVSPWPQKRESGGSTKRLAESTSLPPPKSVRTPSSLWRGRSRFFTNWRRPT